MCDILYRSAGIWALFCLLAFPGGLHPMPGLAECDNATGGLTEQCISPAFSYSKLAKAYMDWDT